MRFQTGKGWPYSRRSRGPGRGEYRMSRAAYQARLRNLVGWNRARTYEQTRRIEVEIALAMHRGETFRATAKRLGLRSHAHCWRVARKYRAGLIPMLPPDEQKLMAMPDSLDYDRGSTSAESPTIHAPGCRCDACICTECEKQRDPRDGAGHVLLLNRCLCVRHGENCGCASCQIARAIASARAETTPGHDSTRSRSNTRSGPGAKRTLAPDRFRRTLLPR